MYACECMLVAWIPAKTEYVSQFEKGHTKRNTDYEQQQNMRMERTVVPGSTSVRRRFIYIAYQHNPSAMCRCMYYWRIRFCKTNAMFCTW